MRAWKALDEDGEETVGEKEDLPASLEISIVLYMLPRGDFVRGFCFAA